MSRAPVSTITAEQDSEEPKHGRRKLIAVAILAGIVLLTRIPFLDAGYGNDTDAWLVAGAARSIGETGQFLASRLPGYPVHELTCSLFWWGGPVVLNGLTAVMSGVAVFFFGLSLQRLGNRHYLLASSALAFLPVFYVNSTVSMDYVWAIAFIMIAFYLALKGHALAAGVALGIAIGCRITSGAMIIPLSVLFYTRKNADNPLKKVTVFILLVLVIAGLAFVPPFLAYGPGFFNYYKVQPPTLFAVFKGASEDVWGAVGLVALAAVLSYQIGYWIIKRKFGPDRSVRLDAGAMWASALSVAIYFLAYIFTPYEPEYLLPALPFLIILFASLLNRKAFVALCAALVVSPFLVSFGRLDTEGFVSTYQWRSELSFEFSVGGKPYFVDMAGPVVADFNRRHKMVRYLESILAEGAKKTDRSVIVVGRWIGPLALLAYEDLDPDPSYFRRFMRDLNDLRDVPSRFRMRSQPGVVYEHWLRGKEMREYTSVGYKIFYSPDYREMNILIHGIDFKEIDAIPLPIPK